MLEFACKLDQLGYEAGHMLPSQTSVAVEHFKTSPNVELSSTTLYKHDEFHSASTEGAIAISAYVYASKFKVMPDCEGPIYALLSGI